MTAEDRQSIASMSVGRTSVSYRTGSQNGSGSLSLAERYNLSRDAENWLRMAGFGLRGWIMIDKRMLPDSLTIKKVEGKMTGEETYSDLFIYPLQVR